jgi:CubicO group peptidase (beta-lactamase class C family)
MRTKRRISALVIAGALVASLPVAAEANTGAQEQCSGNQIDVGGTCTPAAEVAREIVATTRSVMAAEDAKAVILRVDVGDQTVVNRGIGDSMAGSPANPRMKFRPGAMTIPMLTTIALQLQEDGRLSLDDTLSEYFAEYPNADRVTLRMLASVTSGYPDYIQENPPFQAAQLAEPFRQWTDDELLDYAFAQPIVCDPGTCFHYAHTNFILLGRVVEQVTGKSVEELVTETFLRPLGMRDTKITKFPAIPPPALHAYTDERGVYEDSSSWSPSWGLGNGLIMTSTARDMIKLFDAVGTGSLLSKSSAAEQVEPLSEGLPGAPSAINYGLGIVVGNNGWVFQNPIFNGYAGIVAYLPSREISMLIENSHGPNAAPGSSIATSIFQALTKYLTPNEPV